MTINKEIVVYMNQPYNKFRWLGIVASVQMGFVFLNLVLMPTNRLMEERREALENRLVRRQDETKGELVYESNPDHDPATVWQRLKRLNYTEIFSTKNIIEKIRDRPYFTTLSLGTVILIQTALNIYCRRMAHIITLLPNERVRFTSFSSLALGKPPSVELPLSHVSCVKDRKAPENYSILKLKGYKGYHLIQKREGLFLEPKLFDLHLGYSKSWDSTKAK